MPPRRPDVVITGVGMVTPLGATAAETLAAWQAGACAGRLALPELAGTRLAHWEVSELPGLQAAARSVPRRMQKSMCDGAIIGAAAAHEALAEAGALQRFQPERVGLYAAFGPPGVGVDELARALSVSLDEAGEFCSRRFGSAGIGLVNPLLTFKALANIPACQISILEGILGPSLVFSPWEAEGGAALMEAWHAVAEGEVDCALAGASADPTHPAQLLYLAREGLLAEGEAPAAAAAYLVLERAEDARRDGRRAYAGIAGLAVTPWDRRAAAQPAHGVAGPVDGRMCAPSDPLSARMGRSFAAAPAVLLALACLEGRESVAVRGVGGWEFSARLEGPA